MISHQSPPPPPVNMLLTCHLLSHKTRGIAHLTTPNQMHATFCFLLYKNTRKVYLKQCLCFVYSPFRPNSYSKRLSSSSSSSSLFSIRNMSQQQPRRTQATTDPDQTPITYGDVFDVSGQLASEPIAPHDASAMQAAENLVIGKTQKGGPAAVMQSAAAVNQQRGVVGHDGGSTIATEQGVTISEAEVIAGHRIITEAVGEEVVGQYVEPGPRMKSPAGALDRDAITIGEALEATALSAGNKPVNQSDAAAIQAAEIRASGSIHPGGVAATAQSAADLNARTNANKTLLSDVLADATTKLVDDKAVTREDAEGVIGAEVRNTPDLATYPGGVSASMAAAARLNYRET